jgi:hypothetical protein
VKKIWAVLPLMGLAGCVSPETANQAYANMAFANQQPPSAQVRKVVADYARKQFYDPYSMRDVSLSYVMTGNLPGKSVVCLRANAKNRLGAYTGLSGTGLRMTDNVITDVFQETPECNDGRLKYVPFPELERA